MHLAIAGSTGLVGRPLRRAAEAAGHRVTALSRGEGTDLMAPSGLEQTLAGVEAVIDVTNYADRDRSGAHDAFSTIATNLGRAATAAGVQRTVVLSIIGVDRTPDEPYYVAKLAHEQASLEHAPGVRILRAAQFHEFPGQSIGWGRDGDTVTILDTPMQPVALDEVVRVLLELATGARDADLVELAGPQQENLVDLATRVLARQGDPARVVPAPVSQPVRDGALLPGPEAIIAGPTFDEWLTTQPR